ncbi:hypothetical protein [Arsenophonus nasoniae]|uniref:Uncharacterized protein n=1 Tax=Arsenophonus nasoniae TaxID=638 RepID=A0AA95GWE4_9GAMM|nr:hypothetical protein [Arsenophonus nasoniae]WGM03524.1 hypothetical protein QE210_19130 [Arsenophonus nasoniae]WGM03763.1 hypothetical protein QE210_20275 [Arsenophonus nasoniae]WGM03871.1 hypothetical protein QE210_20535 [Arsenophonus nasoniae]WGM03930.1 hypothetical protein QE210_20825 [Arsenophonus nasoniae]
MLKSKLLEKAKKQFEELDKLKVEVGVLENTRPYKDSDISVVEVATIHEFGTEKIQPRSFLRVPIRDHQKAIIEKAVKEKYRLFISGEISAKEFLAYIGEEAVTWSKEAFDTQGFGSWPEYKQSTLEKKYYEGYLITREKIGNAVKYTNNDAAKLLRVTGNLANSITYQVVKK